MFERNEIHARTFGDTLVCEGTTMLRHPYRKLGLAALTCALTVGAAWSLSSPDGEASADLVALTDPLGESMDSRESAYVSFNLFPVCLSAPGEVEITAVEPIKTRGTIAVTDFSTVSVDQIGTNASTDTVRIRDVEYFQGPKTVKSECSKDRRHLRELVVEIHVPEPNTKGFVDGLRIQYVAGSEEKTTEAPVTLGACRLPEECAQSDLAPPER